MGKILGMAAMVLLGLYGLFASANAHDIGFYLFGLLLAGFSILMLFRLVVLATRSEQPGQRKEIV